MHDASSPTEPLNRPVPLWKRPHLILVGISATLIVVIVVLFAQVFGLLKPPSSPVNGTNAIGQGYWHTNGTQILDAEQHQVRIAGINWFGLETTTFAPEGLQQRSYQGILEQVRSLHYNTIRLPYSSQLFDQGSTPKDIDYSLNPDLRGLNGLQIMDKIVDYAGKVGLHIILDRHRPDANAQSSLWYTSAYSEARWLDDWRMLANHYNGNTTIIGADLDNEPHASACWGCGDPQVDWHQAATKAGNAILAINPHWLIFVEGVECYGSGGNASGDCYWWGGNLKGVSSTPIELNVPHQLVYSVHDYPASVTNHSWFSAPDYPRNLVPLWESHWGYILQQNIAPVWVGEFGTKLQSDSDKQWFSALVNYLGSGVSGINWTYWCLNPTSADTGGILQNDWKTVDQDKQQYLNGILFPFDGDQAKAEAASSNGGTKAGAGTATPTGATANGSAGVQLSYATTNANTQMQTNQITLSLKLANSGQNSINLSDITIRYWYTIDGQHEQKFWCDYATLGCSVVSGQFVTLPSAHARADTYLEVGFSSTAGSLDAGKDSGEIKVRFNKTDWSTFDQSNDYSYPGPTLDYTQTKTITVYYKGKLVWGQEPG